MKRKITKRILSILLLLTIMPLCVLADNNNSLKISVHDVIVPTGEVAQLTVYVDGGSSPYEITWTDSFNRTVGKDILSTPGTSSISLIPNYTSDYKIKVTDAEGNISTDAVRLIARDFKTAKSSFENISLSPNEIVTGFYNKSSVPNTIGWNTSFVSGSFVFSSLQKTKNAVNKTGFSCSNLSSGDCSQDFRISAYQSVTGGGNQNSSNYAVVTDSAYISYADPSLEARPVSGFYITNSLALNQFAKNSRDLNVSIKITNTSNGKSINHTLINVDSKNPQHNYCSNNWNWVDLRSLNFTKGTLKLKVCVNSSDKHISKFPHTICLDDFNGILNTNDLSPRLVGVNSVINLEDVIPVESSSADSEFTIYSIEGGYPQDASFSIKNNQLRIQTPCCNVKITVKLSSHGDDRYFTIPIIVDAARKPADFNDCEEIDMADTPANSILRSGSFVFSPDNDSRSAFYCSSDLTDSILKGSCTQPAESSICKRNPEFAVMSNSGYIYNMCHEDSISGFYIKLSEKTYKAIVDGENLGEPYRQGDSLVLYVTDLVSRQKLAVPLADYNFTKESDNYCVKSWQWVNLKPLGVVNSLHLTLLGTKFSKYNLVPECYLDNFGGIMPVRKLNVLKVGTTENKKYEILLDSCFGHNTDPLVTYKYELESANGLDSSSCVQITGNKLCGVSSHNDQFDIIVKATLNGSTEYLSVPLQINVYEDEKESEIRNANAQCSSIDNTAKAVKPKDETLNKSSNIDGTRKPLLKQAQTNPNPSDKSQTPEDSLNNDKPLVTDTSSMASDDSMVIAHKSLKETNANTNTNETANKEEPTDMRIVYTTLFLFLLLILLMYMYNKRQRLRSKIELESLQKRYAESIALYDKAKDEIASLAALKQKYRETLTDYEKVKAELQSLYAVKDEYAASVAESERLKKELENLTALCQKYAEQMKKYEQDAAELETLRQLQPKYDEALAGKQRAEKTLQDMKKKFEKKLADEKSETENLKNLLSSYQDNVNPDEWDAEQSLFEHETVVKLHRDVDGAHMATEKQWNDLGGVVSKLLPDFYSALSAKSSLLSDNEFKVCLLTRLKFLPTEMAVLLNLSKQRITNIRAAVNKKLFNESGTKTFENNMFNLGN